MPSTKKPVPWPDSLITVTTVFFRRLKCSVRSPPPELSPEEAEAGAEICSVLALSLVRSTFVARRKLGFDGAVKAGFDLRRFCAAFERNEQEGHGLLVQIAIDEDHPDFDFDQIGVRLHGEGADGEKHSKTEDANHGSLSRKE